jgi:intein/homing endonuclease
MGNEILNPNDFTLIPTPDGHKTVAELCGWTTDPVLREEAFNLLAQWPRLQIVGDIPGRTYTGQRSMLFEVYRGAGLSDPPNYPQEIGCCVSMGMKNACEYGQLIDITQGAREEFKLIFPPYIYGICRNQIGQGRISGDGAMGVWAAEGVVKYGVIPADAEGCPKYSGSVAKKWGSRSGVPEEFIKVGKIHLVKECAKISSWEDALKALVNGYPLTVASDYGFDMKARSDGFMKHSTTWNHQMCGTPYVVTSYIKSKFMKDVKVGDELFGHDGKPHYVTKVFKRNYSGKIMVIKVSGNLPLELTPNHPVLVLRDDTENFDFKETKDNILIASKIEKKKKVWVNADEIIKGDWVICPIPDLSSHKPVIPQWMPASRSGLPQLFLHDELAWLFGLYIADGGAEPNRRITIKLAVHEKEEAKRAVSAIRLLGIEPTVKFFNNHIAIRAHSASLANSCLEWFGKQTNKHIPEWLMTWNLERVIEGIYAGDGNVPTGRPEGRRIVNTSRILIDQIRNILLYLGHRPSVSQHIYTGKNSHWNIRYIIEWYPKQKRDHINRFLNRNYVMRVFSINQKDYDGDVYNFEVEGSHTYIAEGIVVHNCAIGIDDGDDKIEPHAAILNSWGDVFGEIKDFRTGSIWPKGSLRIRKKDFEGMIRQGECFAVSGISGFEARVLERGDFNL